MMCRKRIHKLLLIPAILFLAGVFYLMIGYACSRHLEVTNYTIEAPLKNPIRIVQLSDLHDKQFGQNNCELIEMIKEQDPDMVVMTGDMVDRNNFTLDRVCSLISQLKDTARVFYSFGNHEFFHIRMDQVDFDTPLIAAGAKPLASQFEDLEMNGNEICVGGCSYPYRDFDTATSNEALREFLYFFADDFENTDRYKILLNHYPSSFLEKHVLDECSVDLVLSGDYHGGVFRIPFIDKGVYVPEVGLFPEFTKGVYKGKNGTMVLSAGLGDARHIPRVFNPPEIVVIDLVPQNENE